MACVRGVVAALAALAALMALASVAGASVTPERQADDGGIQQQRKRMRRSVNGFPIQDLVNAFQDPGLTDVAPYIHFTPSTPAPQDINCYVDVPTTTRVGGQCIQLGAVRGRAGPWACQSGMHLAFTRQCQPPRSRSNRQSRPGRG